MKIHLALTLAACVALSACAPLNGPAAAPISSAEGAGTRIELVTIGDMARVPVDRTPPPSHLGILGYKALVFDTEDLQAVTKTLEAHGVEIVWADQQLSPLRRSTMIRDPEGNMIHFFGPLSK